MHRGNGVRCALAFLALFGASRKWVAWSLCDAAVGLPIVLAMKQQQCTDAFKHPPSPLNPLVSPDMPIMREVKMKIRDGSFMAAPS